MTPSEALLDRDIVTLPLDMVRNNLIRISTRLWGEKGKVIIELNAVFLKSASSAPLFNLTSCLGKSRCRAPSLGQSAEPVAVNIHEVSELAGG